MSKNIYKILKINAREILDSRGNPTVEAEVILDCGILARASVPSGASVGEHEALELRDKDKKRYGGMGVTKACENINTKISRKLKGTDILGQQEIDHAMIRLDNSSNKSSLGANAMLAVSLACCRAGAIVSNLELYKYIRKIYNIEWVTKHPSDCSSQELEGVRDDRCTNFNSASCRIYFFRFNRSSRI